MRLAIVYTDKRGKYLVEACSKLCDVVEFNFSDIKIPLWVKCLSALVAIQFNRQDWSNDYYRNPIFVKYSSYIANKLLVKKNIGKVDAVLQFGLMFPVDYSILENPKVCIYADGVYDANNSYWKAPRFGNWFSGMQKKIYKKIDIALTFSEWARIQLHERYCILSEKIVKCGWGPCLPVPMGITVRSGAPRKLLFIGIEAKRKGLDVLLEAYRVVKGKFKDVSLDVVGVNEYPGAKSDANISFHGLCDKQSVIGFMSKADLFILPSRYERAGHVVVEAMSYGLPVIVTDTCGAPEPVIAGNCGYVVTPGSVSELSDAILKIVSNPVLAEKMSANAINEAVANWTWDKVCSQMMREIKITLEK